MVDRTSLLKGYLRRYSTMLKWFVIAALGNLLTPSFTIELVEPVMTTGLYDLTISGLLGFLGVEVAMTSILGALVDAPLKYRVPTAILVCLGLAVALVLGLQMSNNALVDEECAAILSFGFLALTFGIGLIFLYRSATQSVLIDDQSTSDPSTQIRGEQFSIKYLLIAMTIVSLALAAGKALGVDLSILFEQHFWQFILAGIIFLLFVAVPTLLVVELSLRKNSASSNRMKAILLLGSASIIPCLIPIAINAISVIPRCTPDSVRQLYCFFACYIPMLILACYSLRLSGLRLRSID